MRAQYGSWRFDTSRDISLFNAYVHKASAAASRRVSREGLQQPGAGGPKPGNDGEGGGQQLDADTSETERSGTICS